MFTFQAASTKCKALGFEVLGVTLTIFWRRCAHNIRLFVSMLFLPTAPTAHKQKQAGTRFFSQTRILGKIIQIPNKCSSFALQLKKWAPIRGVPSSPKMAVSSESQWRISWHINMKLFGQVGKLNNVIMYQSSAGSQLWNPSDSDSQFKHVRPSPQGLYYGLHL